MLGVLNLKKFILGLIVGCVISFSIGSFASGVWNKIDVLENDIKIFANGEEITTPSFVYNDTTYVPLRAVLEKIDCEVTYDEELKEIHAYNKFVITSNKSLITYGKTINGMADGNFDVYELSAHSINGEYFFINWNELYGKKSDAAISQNEKQANNNTMPWHLYSNDGKKYLGKLTLDKYDVDSIFNQYGTHGSKYNVDSIWNEYGTYGSKYSLESAFNKYTLTPPKIVDNNGNLIGYLTTNSSVINSYTIETLTQFLKNNSL